VDNGQMIILWIGQDVNIQWLQSVFGVSSLEELC